MPKNLRKVCIGANITLNCTGYRELSLWVSTLFNFQFQYSDQLGKTFTFRNTSANAVVRYSFKDSNYLMTITMTMNYLLLTSKLDINCLGDSNLYGGLGWQIKHISVVNDNESKLH